MAHGTRYPARRVGLGTILLGFILLGSPSTALVIAGEPGPNQEAVESLGLDLIRLHQRRQREPSPHAKARLREQMRVAAEIRAEAFRALAATDVRAAIRAALPTAVVRRLPDDVRAHCERRVERKGTLREAIAEDTETLTAQRVLVVSRAGDALQAPSVELLAENPDSHIHLLGRSVRVRGLSIPTRAGRESIAINPDAAGEIAASAGGDSGDSGSGGDSGAQGGGPNIKQVALVLFNFRNDTSQPWTVDKVRSTVFTNSNSVQIYYQELSFGAWDLQGRDRADGDVYGWYTIPYDNTLCDYMTWALAAEAEANKAGVVLSEYDTIGYAFPSTSACKWTGLAYIPGQTFWINGQGTSVKVIGHELGHNFGVHHASSYTCTDAGQRVPLSHNCTKQEYGDKFSIMANNTRQMNNYEKGQVFGSGVLDPVNTVDVGSEGGVFTVLPIELASSTGALVVRIPRTRDTSGQVTQYFYLESRQPVGTFDDFDPADPAVTGVSIRLAAPSYWISQSLLLDMTPATSSFADAPLPVGGTFTDPDTGMTIRPLIVDAAGAVVDVRMDGGGSCTHSDPTVSVSPASQWGAAGEALTYSVALQNTDGSACSSSTFSVVPTLPDSTWTQSPSAFSETLAPGASVTRAVAITSPQDAAEGFYSLTETATHVEDPTVQGDSLANYNVSPPDPDPPTVTIIAPKHGATVDGRTTIKVAASDEDGIVGVDFYIDGLFQATDTTLNGNGHYTWTWDARAQPNGPYTVLVNARDGAGNSGTHTITVTLNNR